MVGLLIGLGNGIFLPKINREMPLKIRCKNVMGICGKLFFASSDALPLLEIHFTSILSFMTVCSINI